MIHQPMRLREIEKHAADMGVPLKYAIAARLRYLWQDLGRWFNAETDLMTWHVLCAPRIWAILDDIIQLNRDIRWKSKPARQNEVTEEMKQRAKAYPIERLIEFDSQGKACCFNHQEKTPSLNLNRAKNKAHCFGGCCKSFDPIDVLVIRDGKKYHDAVRQLCG